MPENSNPPVQCAAAVTFRAIRPSDADAVALLHALPGFRFGTLRLPHPSTERIRKWIETMPETHTELGAFECTALVGCGGLTRLSGRRAHTGMIGMGVHDEWTRRGIGTALLRELVTLAEDWHGLRRLELDRVRRQHGGDRTVPSLRIRVGGHASSVRAARRPLG